MQMETINTGKQFRDRGPKGRREAEPRAAAAWREGGVTDCRRCLLSTERRAGAFCVSFHLTPSQRVLKIPLFHPLPFYNSRDNSSSLGWRHELLTDSLDVLLFLTATIPRVQLPWVHALITSFQGEKKRPNKTGSGLGEGLGRKMPS